MLYILVARSLKIPIYGVNLPRHFVLAYLEQEHQNDDEGLCEEQVLFYMNPFNKGAIFTRNEIALYIKQLKVEPRDEYFCPASNRTIIQRMINGLIEVYQRVSNTEKAEALQTLLKALDAH